MENDPKDWSPLRRNVEAFRILEDLRRNGPRLTIPESLVRRTLAAQFNCTPDEITHEQIQWAVSELVPEFNTISVTPPPATQQTEATEPASTEVERRAKLLEDYKLATKIASDRKVYQARNSGIHKPEFYKWRKGTLAPDSATAINFERFLREQKPPR
jgi:hypothetical protein